jgi:hypothetical protein
VLTCVLLAFSLLAEGDRFGASDGRARFSAWRYRLVLRPLVSPGLLFPRRKRVTLNVCSAFHFIFTSKALSPRPLDLLLSLSRLTLLLLKVR